MITSVFQLKLKERIIVVFKENFFDATAAMLSNEVGWFDLEENNTGSLTSILAADATLVRSTLADRLSTIVQNIALTVTAFVIAFILSWRIAAVVIASLPLLIGASITEVSILITPKKPITSNYYMRGRQNITEVTD